MQHISFLILLLSHCNTQFYNLPALTSLLLLSFFDVYDALWDHYQGYQSFQEREWCARIVSLNHKFMVNTFDDVYVCWALTAFKDQQAQVCWMHDEAWRNTGIWVLSRSFNNKLTQPTALVMMFSNLAIGFIPITKSVGNTQKGFSM